MSNDGKTFEERWAFPIEVKRELKAASYDIRPLPDRFRSGRPKLECLFFSSDRKLISRRLAMELVSKRTGSPYHVCEREEAKRPRAPPAPRRCAPTLEFTVDDLYEDATTIGSMPSKLGSS